MALRTLIIQLLFASSGLAESFNFLTYNVAGLPPIFNNNDVPGEKDENARLIGSRLSSEPYDIVHLQEDFAFHAYIYQTDTHPVRTPTSGSVPIGDGLNTLIRRSEWDYGNLEKGRGGPYAKEKVFKRVRWDRCSLNSGDCLTPKGFTFMRMPFEGTELHLYNLHADAGSNKDDVSARSAGIDQILKYVEQNSRDVPVIIGGDTNDRYTNNGRSVTKLLDAKFQDAWIEVVKGGVLPAEGAQADACGNPAAGNECEIVDKVFYRSGGGIELRASDFNYVPEDFLQPDGNILSDHNPILVSFDWKKI